VIWGKKLFQEFVNLANDEPLMAFLLITSPQLWAVAYMQAILS
tara:strand:- start:2133 stop:2261 length:129 start_codon:yes stop_codon:yes gene_type:complete